MIDFRRKWWQRFSVKLTLVGGAGMLINGVSRCYRFWESRHRHLIYEWRGRRLSEDSEETRPCGQQCILKRWMSDCRWKKWADKIIAHKPRNHLYTEAFSEEECREEGMTDQPTDEQEINQFMGWRANQWIDSLRNRCPFPESVFYSKSFFDRSINAGPI